MPSSKPLSRYQAGALPLILAAFLLGLSGRPSFDSGLDTGGTGIAAPAWPEPEATGADPQLRVRRPPSTESPGLSPKQKRDILKHKFEKMKENANELADLAQSLQDDLDASNENVLSLEVVEKAEKIEKLAKKIKRAAKGF